MASPNCADLCRPTLVQSQFFNRRAYLSISIFTAIGWFRSSSFTRSLNSSKNDILLGQVQPTFRQPNPKLPGWCRHSSSQAAFGGISGEGDICLHPLGNPRDLLDLPMVNAKGYGWSHPILPLPSPHPGLASPSPVAQKERNARDHQIYHLPVLCCCLWAIYFGTGWIRPYHIWVVR